MNGLKQLTKLRIFIASPSDVLPERQRLENVVANLLPIADHLRLTLEVVNWNIVVPIMGRPQQVIFDQLEPTTWDVFIGILWHRFGTPPGGADPKSGKDYNSGTEEEFKTAYSLWQQFRRPRIMVYRCIKPIDPETLDTEQFKRVQAFFHQFNTVEGEHPGIYQKFENTSTFERLLLENLQRLLIEYGEKINSRPSVEALTTSIIPKLPDNLPRQSPFFGRKSEMEKILSALSLNERGWGVVIDGIGGIGKTALAVEAAYRAKEQKMFDSFLFVSAKLHRLEPVGVRDQSCAIYSLDNFIDETASILGYPGISHLKAEAKKRAVLDRLRDIRALLIFDNLETLLDEEQEALADFLRFLPAQCKAILTSRRRGGEGALWLRLDQLEWEAAKELIMNEASRDVQLSKKLLCAGESELRKLHDATGGSPLALMHIIGLLRVRVTLTLHEALNLLRQGARDFDLQKFIFELAFKKLTENDKTVLDALSLFPKSAQFSRLMEVSGLSRQALESVLQRLVATSLVNRSSGDEHFSLHPLTRAYILGDPDGRVNITAAAPIQSNSKLRFAQVWTSFAEQFGGDSPASYVYFEGLEENWENLDLSAEWLWQYALNKDGSIQDKAAAKMFLSLTHALRTFIVFSGRWDKDLILNKQAYEVARTSGDSDTAGWRAYDVAFNHFSRLQTSEAALWAQRCAEMWSVRSDQNLIVVSTLLRGMVFSQGKHYAEADALLDEALVAFRKIGNKQALATTLCFIGESLKERKMYAEAEPRLVESLKIATEIGFQEGRATSLLNIGLLALEKDLLEKAKQEFHRALTITNDLQRRDLKADIQFHMARVEFALGRPALALPLAKAALPVHRQIQSQLLAQTEDFVRELESLKK